MVVACDSPGVGLRYIIVFRRDLFIQGPSCRNIVIATDPDWVARRCLGAPILRERVSCGLTVLTTVLLSILGKLWHRLSPHKR